MNLASMEALKYRATGAWWRARVGDDVEWVRSGTGIRQMVETQPVLRALLGCSHLEPTKTATTGIVLII